MVDGLNPGTPFHPVVIRSSPMHRNSMLLITVAAIALLTLNKLYNADAYTQEIGQNRSI